MTQARLDDSSDVLDRLKVLVWQVTDDPKAWEQIVITAIDYGHARVMASIERISRRRVAEPMGGEG